MIEEVRDLRRELYVISRTFVRAVVAAAKATASSASSTSEAASTATTKPACATAPAALARSGICSGTGRTNTLVAAFALSGVSLTTGVLSHSAAALPEAKRFAYA